MKAMGHSKNKSCKNWRRLVFNRSSERPDFVSPLYIKVDFTSKLLMYFVVFKFMMAV